MKQTHILIGICIICMAILTIGDIEKDGRDLLMEEALEKGQIIEWNAPIPPTGNELTKLEKIIELHSSEQEYKTNTLKGSEIYVCTHYAFDMTESLINGGYDAGIIIDYTDDHAMVWLNLNGTMYAVEPQNSEYWIAEQFNLNHNIDYVSLSKGKEFAKESTEGLHR